MENTANSAGSLKKKSLEIHQDDINHQDDRNALVFAGLVPLPAAGRAHLETGTQQVQKCLASSSCSAQQSLQDAIPWTPQPGSLSPKAAAEEQELEAGVSLRARDRCGTATAPSGSGTFQVLSNLNSMDRRAPAALGGSCELRGFLWNLLQGPCGEGSSPSLTEHKVLNRENATSSAGSDGKLGPVVLPLPSLTHLTPPLIENKQQSLSQG